MQSFVVTTLAFVTLCLAGTPTLAQDKEKPWNDGVTQELRDLAQPFFDTGNDYFERSMYAKALTEYEKAIAHRDHPAIRYNMAICLINLGRPVEAYENFLSGTKYGPAPLAEGLYKQASTYLNLLRSQLAEIHVVTEEVGAKVTLNGKLLFIGPGEITLMVKPEQQLLTTSKKGMLLDNQEFLPSSSKRNVIRIKLQSLSEGLQLKQRWPTWKPWSVVGGGVGLAVIGIPLYLFARQNMRDYDEQISILCRDSCDLSELPSTVTRLKSRAELQNISAISLFVSGGVVLASGIVLLVLNRPYTVQQEVAPTNRKLLDARNLSVTPLLGSDGVGVMGDYSVAF